MRLLVKKQRETVPVPLLKQSVIARVVDLAATITIRQLYVNKEENSIGMCSADQQISSP